MYSSASPLLGNLDSADTTRWLEPTLCSRPNATPGASSPDVYSITRAQASTMSSRYAASSRDTSSLGLDSCAQAWLKRRAGHQIDLHPEAVFQKQLQAHVPVEGRASDEVDEHVEVARVRGVTACHRAEDREVANAEASTCRRHELGESSEGDCAVRELHDTWFAVEPPHEPV